MRDAGNFYYTFYWVSVISGYHRLSWHQDIVMKYFDTHIFVIIHFAPLFISEWPNIRNFREYEDRHKVIIVNLLKIIGDCWQTKQITARKTNTTSSCYKIKPHYLNHYQNDSVILFMWAQQFGENILLRVRTRPDVRRQTDEWAWRGPVKNISDWVIREIASGGEAPRKQSPWNRSDIRWACETIPLARQNKNKHIKKLVIFILSSVNPRSSEWLNRVCDGSVEFEKRHRELHRTILTFKSQLKVIEKHGTMMIPAVKYIWSRMANCVKIILLVFLVTTRASLGVQETRHRGNFILTGDVKIQRLKRKEIVKARGALTSRQIQSKLWKVRNCPDVRNLQTITSAPLKRAKMYGGRKVSLQ